MDRETDEDEVFVLKKQNPPSNGAGSVLL